MSIFKEIVESYLLESSPGEDILLEEIRRQAKNNNFPTMSPLEGKFLQLIATLSGGNRILELGTGYGYSAIWLAKGLSTGGIITTIDINEEIAQMAKDNFRKAGVEDQIDLVVGKSGNFLNKLEPGFDLIFIDEYKDFYISDLNLSVPLLNNNGILLAHNAFEGGWVSGKVEDDLQSQKLRNFHQTALNHPELDSMLLSIGEGFLFGIKKS